MLQSMESQRVAHGLVTEKQKNILKLESHDWEMGGMGVGY